MITAAELACFVYCPEQWRLQYGVGIQPANQAELATGERHHARKALGETVAGRAIGFGRVLVVIGVLMLLLLWLVWR